MGAASPQMSQAVPTLVPQHQQHQQHHDPQQALVAQQAQQLEQMQGGEMVPVEAGAKGSHKRDRTAPVVDLENLSDEERKKQIRLQRNRQAAHQSRERKKLLVRNLEEKIKILTQQNLELTASCRALLLETRRGFPC